MKSIIFTLLAFLCSLPALSAQSPIVKYFYDKGYSYRPKVLSGRPNGDYFLAQWGAYYDTTHVVYIDIVPAGIYAHAMLNHLGDTIWERQSLEPASRSQETYVEDGQGLFTFFRNSLDNYGCDDVLIWLPGWSRVQYYQINKDGHTGPEKALNTGCEAVFHDGISLPNGRKVLICTRENKLGYLYPDVYGQIVVLDHNNDGLYEHSYPGATFEAAKLVIRDDCSLLMACYRKGHLLISIVSEGGAILDTKSYESAIPQKMIALGNGQFLLMAHDAGKTPFLCALDKDGNILWRKYFPKQEIVDVTKLTNGSVALLYNGTGPNFGVLQLDDAGNIHQNRPYALSDTTAQATLIAPGQHGTYAIAGYERPIFKVHPGRSFLLIDTLPLPALPAAVPLTKLQLRIFKDVNGNCVEDNGESLLRDWRMDMTNAVGTAAISSGSVLSTTPGSYAVALTAPRGQWAMCPFNGNLNIQKDTIVTIGVKDLCQTRYADIDTTVCQGSYYSIHGLRCYVGLNRFHLIGKSGCDSIVTIRLRALPKFERSIKLSFCKGGSVTYQGVSYFQSDTLTFHYNTPRYCDSLVTVILTETPAIYRKTYEICTGETVRVGTSVYTLPGVYTNQFTSSAGCDSTVVTTVQRRYIQKGTVHYLCPDRPLRIGNRLYTQIGRFPDTVHNPAGCDTLYMRTILNGSTTYFSNVQICRGDTYTWGDTVLRTAGRHTRRLKSWMGCDSILNIDIKFYESVSFFNFTMYPGQIIRHKERTFYKPGTYIDTVTSYRGCDSIITTSIHLRVGSAHRNIQVCRGQTYTLNGQNYSPPAIVCDTFPSCYGSDSVVYFTLSHRYYYSEQEQYICPGRGVSVGNHLYIAPGDYLDTIPYVSGCELVMRTKVYWSNIEKSISMRLCPGESVVFNNTVYNKPGSYYIRLKSWRGCDSTIQLYLFAQTVRNVNYYMCPGTPVTIAGRTLTQPVRFSDTLSGFRGCDSIINYWGYWNHVNQYRSFYICPGEKVTVGNSVYTRPGSYRDTFKTWRGCDSIVFATLYWSNKSRYFTYQICPGQSVRVANSVYVAPGNYTDTLKTWKGCDSIIQTLVQWRSPGRTIQAEVCSGGTVSIAGRRYTAPGIYRDTLTSFQGCDSILLINICYSRTSVRTEDKRTICFGDTLRWGGNGYHLAGFYTDTFPARNGCDSIVRLELRVLAPVLTTRRMSICQGDSVLLGNTVVITAGTYVFPLKSYRGCDSTSTVIVSMRPSQKDSVFVTVAVGGSFEGVTIRRDTFFQRLYKNRWDCDSTIVYFVQAVTHTQETGVGLAQCKLVPNPNNGHFFLETTAPAPQTLHIQIFNAAGVLLLTQREVRIPSGHQRIPLHLPEALPGLYWVMVQDVGRRLWKQRMVVQQE